MIHFGLRNFLRKWHIPWNVIREFNDVNISYKKLKCKLVLNFSNMNILYYLEPFFDTIITNNLNLVNDYIEKEQLNTCFILKDKFIEYGHYDFVCYIGKNQNINIDYISKLQYIVNGVERGRYNLEDLIVELT